MKGQCLSQGNAETYTGATKHAVILYWWELLTGHSTKSTPRRKDDLLSHPRTCLKSKFPMTNMSSVPLTVKMTSCHHYSFFHESLRLNTDSWCPEQGREAMDQSVKQIAAGKQQRGSRTCHLVISVWEPIWPHHLTSWCDCSLLNSLLWGTVSPTDPAATPRMMSISSGPSRSSCCNATPRMMSVSPGPSRSSCCNIKDAVYHQGLKSQEMVKPKVASLPIEIDRTRNENKMTKVWWIYLNYIPDI